MSKKRKFVGMTNAEYLERKGLCDFFDHCPHSYGLEDGGDDADCFTQSCQKCWDSPAKRNGRYILKEVKEKRLTYLERKYLGEDNV